jgi:hypothetical protein
MIDAEEAEALAQAAAEKVAARAQVDATPARQRPRPGAVEQERAGTTIVGQQAEVPDAEVAPPRPGAAAYLAAETLQHASAEARTNGVSVAEQADTNGRLDPREDVRTRKRLVKADKLAAKKAARELASLEKKEARERKALAKAAARRH